MSKETTRQIGRGLCGNIIDDPDKIWLARRNELEAKGLSFYEREDLGSARLEDIVGGKRIFVPWETKEDPRLAQIVDLKTKIASYQEDRKDLELAICPLGREEVKARIEEIERRMTAISQEMLEGV